MITTIIINCIISKEGKITNAVIAKASPKGYFESACLDILEKIRYKPATVDGKPVAQRMELTFDFGLHNLLIASDSFFMPV